MCVCVCTHVCARESELCHSAHRHMDVSLLAFRVFPLAVKRVRRGDDVKDRGIVGEFVFNTMILPVQGAHCTLTAFYHYKVFFFFELPFFKDLLSDSQNFYSVFCGRNEKCQKNSTHWDTLSRSDSVNLLLLHSGYQE